MMRKCINCSWEGEEGIDELHNCPVCGDATEELAGSVSTKTVKNPLDLDGDGDFDIDDKKIAAKVLGSKIKGKGKKK